MTASAATVETAAAFRSWAAVEQLGHRRLAGFVEEVTVAGSGLLKVTVPGDGEGYPGFVQYVAPGTLYTLTPVTEASARALAAHLKADPVEGYDVWSMIRREVDARVERELTRQRRGRASALPGPESGAGGERVADWTADESDETEVF